MRFSCLDPFTRWQLTFDGIAHEVDALHGGPVGGSADEVPVRLAVEASMAAPPWVQGSCDPEGHFNPGEHRFEQHFTAAGTLTVDGTESPFTGGGLRIHRNGRRPGHRRGLLRPRLADRPLPQRPGVRLHALPPPGRLGALPRGLGPRRRSHRPVRPVDVPWMREVRSEGEDVSLVLGTPGGDARVEAETFLSWYRPEKARPGEGTTFPTRSTRASPGTGGTARRPSG